MKYRRPGVVGLATGMLLATIGGTCLALAADPPADVVADGVVTVRWVDPADGPMGGASIRISYYRLGEAAHVALPDAVTDAAGGAQVSGVPRAADGSAAVLLDIRANRSATTTDAAGCTRLDSWLAETDGVTSAVAVEVTLGTSSKGVAMSCPEPPQVVDPAAGGDPQASGDVHGVVGTPRVTLPPTDGTSPVDRTQPETPILPTLLVALGVWAVALPLRARARATDPVARRRRS